jgi:hypothetical protein
MGTVINMDNCYLFIRISHKQSPLKWANEIDLCREIVLIRI